MRHNVFGKHLNRDIKERRALFNNLLDSLIIHGKIKTTLAKAQSVLAMADKLVTKAKNGSNPSLRHVTSVLTRKETINKLTKEIVPKFTDKTSGFVRMTKLGKRVGDNAEVVTLEWTV
jgi:large subunit ribosomal protein L17